MPLFFKLILNIQRSEGPLKSTQRHQQLRQSIERNKLNNYISVLHHFQDSLLFINKSTANDVKTVPYSNATVEIFTLLVKSLYFPSLGGGQQLILL